VGSVGDGRWSDQRPRGGGYWLGIWYFLILPIEMVHSGVLFILICPVNWLDVEELNSEVGLKKS